MAGSPIKLTLYDKNNEPIKELSQGIIPWGIMKQAIKLSKSLKVTDGMTREQILANMDEEAVDSLTGLVAEVFTGEVTVEDLNKHVEFDEMLTVLMQIMTKIGIVIGKYAENPTPPGE